VSNARLPDNIRAIWTPRDAVDTAAQFHLEVDNAERGVEIADRAELRQAFDPQGWLMSQGRERRARIMDALAVALLMALMGALGCAVLLMAAPKAKADADPVAVAYAAHFADAVCWTLTNHDTNSGVLGVLAAIKEDGLTTSQAAYAVTLSVMDVCPQQQYVLDRFIDRYGPIQEKLA
jgi:hypothetical protein